LTIVSITGVRWNLIIVLFTFLSWVNILNILYWLLHFLLWQYSWVEKYSCIFLSQKAQNYHFNFLIKGTISVFREKKKFLKSAHIEGSLKTILVIA
jgi:hypothetical protein